MPLINFNHVMQYVTDVTDEQIGKCHPLYDSANQPLFAVENERGDRDLDGGIIEYAVRYSEKYGFSCSCPAGHEGFAHVGHRSGVCKHVRWCVACVLEARAALTEMESKNEPEGSPRPDWYREENETSYHNGTRRHLLLTGHLEATDQDYARVMNAQPYPWTEAEIKRDQQRYQSHPFNLMK